LDISSIIEIVNSLLMGGPHAIVVILTIAMVALLFDRKRLMNELERKETKLDEMVESYQKSTLALAESLNALKVVLAEIRGSLR
jgi:Tfp pilus assembly protein PilO